MRRSIFACGLLLVLAGISSAVATAAGGTGDHSPAAQNAARAQARQSSVDYWNAKAQRAQAATARALTIVHGHPPKRFAHTSEKSSPQAARDFARAWQRRAKAAWRAAKHPPKLHAWYCIHNREGSWTDPDAPYWGGLQMDMNFQSAYAPWLLKHKGTADHWSPLAQIWAGVRAWRTRGFEPWSSSAHACGVY